MLPTYGKGYKWRKMPSEIMLKVESSIPSPKPRKWTLRDMKVGERKHYTNKKEFLRDQRRAHWTSSNHKGEIKFDSSWNDRGKDEACHFGLIIRIK